MGSREQSSPDFVASGNGQALTKNARQEPGVSLNSLSSELSQPLQDSVAA